MVAQPDVLTANAPLHEGANELFNKESISHMICYGAGLSMEVSG